MKKISLLKKIGLGIASAAASVPLILTAASCSKGSAVVANYISFNALRDEFHPDTKPLPTIMKNGHYSNDEILLGTDKFFNGNYILFVGSNTFDLSRRYFTGWIDPQLKPTMDTKKWFNNFFGNSLWYQDIQQYPNRDLLNRKFGFVTFIDDFDTKFYDKDGHRFWVCNESRKEWLGIEEAVNPFETWTQDLITQTKNFMEKLKIEDVIDYDWDDEAVSVGEYIRQDKQAKAYRSFCKRGLEYFPTNETRTKSFVTDNSDGSLMVIYKDGKLQEIVSIPTDKNKKRDDEKLKDKDTATLLGAINKYYADIEDDPE